MSNVMPKSSHPSAPTLERIVGEYLEMPGLNLTTKQAQRLWGMDETQCKNILGALVEAGFLVRTPRGYVRHSQERGGPDPFRQDPGLERRGSRRS